MTQRHFSPLWIALLLAGCSVSTRGEIVYETTSVYHHIQVVDEGGFRILSFDGSHETRMSLQNPLQGHFQYTEYFHMPWLWNDGMTNVLMIGLGGGSTQRAYQHYYPQINVDTAEIDPKVVEIAKKYFHVQESPTLKIHVSDGRVFVKRSQKKYDAIILDAYVKNRYGSFIPFHLVTKEFFELARDHLTEDGVLAYNVMGRLSGWRADIVGAVYKTLKTVYPQVYLFPATDSYNVVIIATRSETPMTLRMVGQRVNDLISEGKVTFPGFRRSAQAFQSTPPRSFLQSPLLTDDHAPVDGLLSRTN